ncbi:asparagine synthase [Pseudothauera nasutitermitis]|uniref:asparagine synthase (glutamine-hydrolyzing) n=1 Tax=Pseudothauera nasutitermitis TaxID=2565930 RepID=A0A4S4AY35_9RHOO|nr:asparagine synthase C-terminal domain-containing protein [Pseudothauera nasutitermitis]THF64870.1 asparagine synthase [Pseudothauera nasutitermitis]
MSHAYLVLIEDACQPGSRDSNHPSVSPRSAGMQLRATLGTAFVFTSSDTPTLQLPNGAVIIGDLYSLSGNLIQASSQISGVPSDASEARRLILQNYWGDYILVMQEASHQPLISITRGPSPASDLLCFYSARHGKTFATSDISLVTRLGHYHKLVDFDYIAHRLIYPSLKTSRTGIADVSELLPGCTLRLTNGHANVAQDWSPWNFVDKNARYSDHHEAALAIRTAIKLVVAAWANQDKSILLELSGGLDSSIVGACLKDTHANVTCGTLTTSTPGADEREYAALVADMLGAELLSTQLQYDYAQFEFPLPQRFVTPVIGPLQYAIDRVMMETADQYGVTSYFSGAGGDTVFCYQTSAAPAADAFLGAGISTGIRTIQDISMFHQCTYWKAGRLTFRKLFQRQDKLYDIDRTLLSKHIPLPTTEQHPWLSPPNEEALIGDRQRIFELSATHFFRDSCLRATTRRFRMPLLSQPVIEACLRAPSWMWFSGGQNRAVARHAFADELPPRILARKSKGSFTSYLGALYRRRRGEMLHFLLNGVLQSQNLLDAGALRTLTQSQSTSDGDTVLRVLQLCTLENWVRQQSKSS